MTSCARLGRSVHDCVHWRRVSRGINEKNASTKHNVAAHSNRNIAKCMKGTLLLYEFFARKPGSRFTARFYYSVPVRIDSLMKKQKLTPLKIVADYET